MQDPSTPLVRFKKLFEPTNHRRCFQRRPSLYIESLEERLMLANDDGFPDVISVGRTLSAWSAADVQNGELTITYSVYNQREDAVSGVLLATTLEPGVTFVGATVPPDRNGQELAWSLGTIEAFGRASVEVTVALANAATLQIDGGACAFGTVNARAEDDCANPARLRAEAIDSDLLRSTPDANAADPFVLAKAAELNQDAAEIFAFLRDEVGYESYVGSLRGARGTLWSSAGNALDEASLMVALLRSSGIPARYVSGTLPDNLAQQLILSMFPPSIQTIGFVPAGAAVADPANDPKLLAETRQHFWVQFDGTDGDGAVFTNADATFADATLGQTFAPTGGTFSEVPDNLRHKVTVRLNRELTIPGLFGSFQTTETVLSQTFNTVELVGHPLTVGHFVSTTQLGFLFSSTTHTYSPFVMVGDNDRDLGDDELIRGTDYQEVLTNFPFGSQILTGVFLELEVLDPSRAARTYEHTILDRIGFAARQGLGSGTISLPPSELPAITPFDNVTIHVDVGRIDPGATAAARARDAALQDELLALQASTDVNSTDPEQVARQQALRALTQERLLSATQVIGPSFSLLSDEFLDQVMAYAQVKAYYDSPRLIVASSRVVTDAQDASVILALDLSKDDSRALASPGQNLAAVRTFRFLRGVAESAAESQTVAAFRDASNSSAAQSYGAADVLMAAREQNIALVLVSADNFALLDSLPLSADATARITQAISAGRVVVVPVAAPMLAGQPRIAWLEIDPHTGETIDTHEDGSHSGIVQYAATFLAVTVETSFLIGLVTPAVGKIVCSTVDNRIACKASFVAGGGLIISMVTLVGANVCLLAQLAAFGGVVSVPLAEATIQTCALIIGAAGATGLALGTAAAGGDPAIGEMLLGATLPAGFSDPTRSGRNVNLPASLSGGSVQGHVDVAAFQAKGNINAKCTSDITTHFSATSLSASPATVRDATGATVGMGTVELAVSKALPVEVSGSVSFNVNGRGELSFYAAATSDLGVSGEWQNYSASLTGNATLQLHSDALVLNGVRLPAGTYTIATNAATLAGSGPSSSPNFAGTTNVEVTDGTIALGPSPQDVMVGGSSLGNGNGLTLVGFNGTAAVAAGAVTDAVQLNGNASHALRVSANPANVTTDQNTPAAFDIVVETSLADTYTLIAQAPDGWTVMVSDSGHVTVTPAPGVQGGTFPIRFSARSNTDPDLVAQGEAMITITPTAPGVSVAVDRDANFFVPFFGAQVPTAFRATIHNDGPAADTFAITFPTVPAGFQIQSSTTMVTIPAGETAIVGVYLIPNGPLPAPGTPASFEVVATSTTNGATSDSEAESFIVPEIHGVTIAADPPELSTTPGAAQQTAIVLQSVGNVPENVTFTADLSDGLMLDGLAPQLLAVGELKVFFVTLTPDPATPLNSTLTAKIDASFGAPESVSVSIPLDVVVPGARSISVAATEARRIGNVDLANRLDDLSIALTNLVQDCSSEVFTSQALAALDAIIGLLGVDPILISFVTPLTAARDQLAAATTQQECLDAVNNLGQTLDGFGDTVFAISEHNVEAFLLPNSQVAQPQLPAQFELRIHNISASVVSTTYNVTLGMLPPGVTGMLSQDSVTLARDEFASVIVTITQTSPTELLAFEFTVTVAADGFPAVARTVQGTLTARREFVSVVSVTPTPPFTDAGGQVAVAARVLNVVNREQTARASFIVRDPNGVQVGAASTPVDVTLTVQASLVNVPLGSIDTNGFANGNYTVEVTLTDMAGQPIPGGTGTGNFLVGSPVTASLDVSPNVLPPGTSTVTNTLEIQALTPLLNPPTVVGQAPVAGATDAIRSGDLVYVAGSGGISIFDVTDESNPMLIRTFGSAAKVIRIRGDKLFAVRESNPATALTIYSLTDPQNPTLLGTTPNIPYNFIHDMVVTDTHAYIVQLQLCYFLASGDIFEQNGDILAVNITNSASPFLERVLFNTNGTNNDGIASVGGCDASGGDSFVWSAAQANANTLLFTSSTSTGTDTQTGVGRVQAVGLDPAAPDWMTVVGEVQIPGTNQVLGIAIDGNRALITADSGNFRDPNTDFFFTGDAIVGTLDITNPRSPQLIHTEVFAGPTRLPGRPVRVRPGLFAFGSHTGTGTEPLLHLVDANDPMNLGLADLDVASSAFERISADSQFIYSASAAGLTIYRVPSSEPFTLVGVQPVSGGSRGVATRKDLAYACGPNGIQVIDYSDPAAPSIQGTIAGDRYGCRVQDNVLLALRPVGNSSILDVYALQNTPLAPPLIGSSPVINYNLLNDLKSNSTHAFVTQLNVCFFLGSNDIYHHAGDLLTIALNLNDSANPTSASLVLDSVLFNTNGDNTFDPTDVPGCAENGGDHNVWGVAFANPQTAYLATTTVTGGDTQAGVGRVQVVDISNPTSPAVVRELDIPGTVQAIGIGISGNTAVVIGSTRGFQDNPNGIVIGNLTVTTLDVTDALDPRIVSSRTLARITSTFWSNFATLGNGLFAFSNLAFENGQGNPAVLLIDASNPRSPLIGQTNVPLDFVPPNSLSTDGRFLFTADAAGISIYEINGLPGLPVNARVQIPNGTDVAIVPGSFNTPPTEIIPGPDFDTLVWDFTLTATGPSEMFTWDSTVSDMQPGESRAVTLDTTIDFGFQGTPGQVLLPPQSVVSEQVLSLDPASQAVRPGEAAMYTVTIANPAQVGVTYDLSIAGVPLEWVDFPAQVMVPAGGSVDLELTLTSDPFSPESTIGFVVTASVGSISGSVEGTLNLLGDPLLPDADPDSHGVIVMLTPDTGAAGQGTAANFVTRVTNTGSVTETFALSLDLPQGFTGILEQDAVEVPPGATNFRDVSLSITPPTGTAPDDYPFVITAVATNGMLRRASQAENEISDSDYGVITVFRFGVDVAINPSAGAPGTTFQLTVRNTGQVSDTFDLSLGGPVALVATLGRNSLTLSPGTSQVIPILVGSVEYLFAGSVDLVAMATSRANAAVNDSADATINIAGTKGLAAEFDPGMADLPDPGPASFLFMVHNTGNVEDAYIAEISGTSGPVEASLIGLDGLPTQSIPLFRLPGLSTGAILLNTNLKQFGQGMVTVQVRSLSTGGIVAGDTATVTSTLDVCEAGPQERAAVGAGNVHAQVVNGRLTITGDKLLNNIRILAGPQSNSLCIIGNEGTTVNGSLVPHLITGVTGSVFITMSGASDTVFFDGSARLITLHGELNIRMNSTRDTLRLDHMTVEGRTRIRTGRGRDLVELVDTVLTGKSSIFTGRGDDTLRVHGSQFLSDIAFDGYLGTDALDAGILRRPNSNGNLFARKPRVVFENFLS